MAVLSDSERFGAWAEFMREQLKLGVAIGIGKADLRAAINAADQWADDNATSYNNALPVAARTLLTNKQKAAVLMYVMNKRWGVL